jgi:hypothetical protein
MYTVHGPLCDRAGVSRLSTRAWAEQPVHTQLTALFPTRQSAKRGIFGDHHNNARARVGSRGCVDSRSAHPLPIASFPLQKRCIAMVIQRFETESQPMVAAAGGPRPSEACPSEGRHEVATFRRTCVALRYLSSTLAPASSSSCLSLSASSRSMPSLTGLGASSTSALASLRPSPVAARTTLMT